MDQIKQCGFVLTCVLMTLLLAGSTWASGFALSGVGSKAIAMGGAFRGLADDYSAAYWNPAGLATQDGFDFSFAGVSILPRFSLMPQVDQPGYAKEVREAQNDPIFVPHAAFFTDVGELSWLRFGIAGYAPAGLTTSIDLYDLPEGFGNATPFPEHEWSTDLRIFDIHPVIAASVLDGKFNIGVGGSIQYASATLERPMFQPTVRSSVFNTLPFGIQRILQEFQDPGQSMMPIDTLMEGDGWGYSVNIGLLLKPLSTLSLGISGRTQSRFDLQGDAVFSLYTPGNPRIAQALGAVPVPQIAELASLYQGRVLREDGFGRTELVLPADIGIGVAWHVSKSLTLTGDATWTGWSAFEELRIELEQISFSGHAIEERVLPGMWEDMVRFSAGAELRPFHALALRGGYYLDPSPIPEQTQGPLVPDIGDKHAINAGIGLRLGSLDLSVNYEYILWPDRTVAPLDANGDGVIDSLPGQYSMSLQSLMSTVTVIF